MNTSVKSLAHSLTLSDNIHDHISSDISQSKEYNDNDVSIKIGTPVQSVKIITLVVADDADEADTSATIEEGAIQVVIKASGNYAISPEILKILNRMLRSLEGKVSGFVTEQAPQWYKSFQGDAIRVDAYRSMALT